MSSWHLGIWTYTMAEKSCLSLPPVTHYRGRSRGRVQGVRPPPPPPTLRWSCLLRIYVFAFKICLPHRQWRHSLEVHPLPEKNPGSAPALLSNVKYWCIQNPTRTIIIAARGVRWSTSSSHWHSTNESEKIQHIYMPCSKTEIHKSSEAF